MFEKIPAHAQDALSWTWEDYKPYFDDLLQRSLTADNIDQWLTDWTSITDLAIEVYCRSYVATTVDTTDEEAKKRFFNFLEDVAEKMDSIKDKMNRKIVDSGYKPDRFEIPLRSIKAAIKLFREENIPLKTEIQKLNKEYDAIAGAQTIEWDGEEKTIEQMRVMLMDSDRDKREKVWRAALGRQLEDRDKLNNLWGKLLDLRVQIADNADKKSFRDVQWIEMGRHDYTPEDDMQFLSSIEEVVVPAVLRRLEKRKQALGVDTLRPWDMDINTTGSEPLKPFEDVQDLINGGANIFAQLDPELSSYYNIMQNHDLLDLDNRKGKAPGGYCITYPRAGHSFIFMNAVGTHDNVQTLLHEAGHAFHNFEANDLPYNQQRDYPTEFAEVASMSMELLALPYVEQSKGGFYSKTDIARAWVEHLDGMLRFWPYMAVVDAFQHWVYDNPQDARSPKNCDNKWEEFWDRFMPGVDWSSFEAIKRTGWHRKLHIFQLPFYYIEYGLAQLGAVQVWRNALQDPQKALAQYRHALALGHTRTLPELFEAAGAKLDFSSVTLSEAVTLIEQKLDEYESQLES